MESGQNNSVNTISIIIPTYNRRTRLITTLNSIFEQDLSSVEKIIIIDNCSNYDIYDLKIIFPNEKLIIYRNPFNIGMILNITNTFMYCQSKWMWLISDDDEIDSKALETITNEIKSNPNIASLKFTDVYKDKISYVDNKQCKTLEEFIDFYNTHGNLGELIFMSNNLYNIDKFKTYFKLGLTHAYTFIPHLVTLLIALNHGESIKLINKKIVTYKLPDKGSEWNLLDIYLGISTISHVKFHLSAKYKKKLYTLFLQKSYMIFYKSLILNYSDFKLHQLQLIYDNQWKYCLSFLDRIFIKFLLFKNTTWFIRKFISNKIN